MKHAMRDAVNLKSANSAEIMRCGGDDMIF